MAILSGAVAAVSDDIVKATAETIAAADWVDVYSVGGLNTGVELGGITDDANGVNFQMGNGIGGAYYDVEIAAGDFFVVADMSISHAADYNVNLAISGAFGFGVGVDTAPDTSHVWWGCGINGLFANAPDCTLEHRRHSTTAGQAWTGSAFRSGFNGGLGHTEMRFGIHRSGTTITTGFVDGTTWVQLDTDASASALAGKLFVHGATSTAGPRIHIKNLNITGLDLVGNQVVPA